MTIDYIREFIVLEKVKNYLTAADALFISQATLSRHIMALEEELGISLFQRSTRSIQLTDDGFRFLPYAYRLMELEDAALDHINILKKIHENRITVGTFNSSRVYGITKMLGIFAQKHPDIHIEDSEGSTQLQIRNILTGKYNIAFVMETSETINDRLSRIQVDTDQLVAILPKNHPFASFEALNLEELKNETFLMPKKGRTLHGIYLAACEKSGFEPKLLNMSLSGHSAVDLVRNNFAIMLMHKKDALSMEPADIVVIDINNSEPLLIDLVYDQNNLSSIEKEFLNYLKGGPEI